jgi:hypothetical protein
MSDTLSYQESTPDVNQEGLNADEQESLALAEQMQGEQQELFAGKFKDAQSLEQAYLELQKKLGEPKENVRNEEGNEEAEAGEEVETSEETSEEEAPSQETLTEAQAQELFKMVGGEKAYQSMINWAGQNLSQEEIQMYDAVMGRGDPNAIFFAVQALSNKYTDAVGNDGQLLTGRSTAEATNVFRSQAELVQAMSDPRYDSDPAYRQDVMRRLDNSNLEF